MHPRAQRDRPKEIHCGIVSDNEKSRDHLHVHLILWGDEGADKNQCHVARCRGGGNRRELEGYCVSYGFCFFSNLFNEVICWKWEDGAGILGKMLTV